MSIHVPEKLLSILLFSNIDTGNIQFGIYKIQYNIYKTIAIKNARKSKNLST